MTTQKTTRHTKTSTINQRADGSQDGDFATATPVAAMDGERTRKERI
jgi:hypothetical protein